MKKKTVHFPCGPAESPERARARASLDPAFSATGTIAQYSSLGTDDELDLTRLAAELMAQSKAIQGGDLSRAEAMLASQAHALDAIFHRLAARAINAEFLPQFEANLRLALRAQSQSRATWETLSAIKNPPVAGYAKQVNVAQGHQQVNNDSRTRESEKSQTQLLEQTDGNRLDARTTGSAGGADSRVEAVGAVHRTEDSGGQTSVGDEGLQGQDQAEVASAGAGAEGAATSP
ncbi:MAG: hypothetical protein U9Q81_18435 [Pseudomonadota bacterium]|nr:hypothetical protein [Pseudomonadota bacterium]